ncbi:MAG: PEP-CTERM sorting domain-containing protein [Desulfobacterales bacterium]|nr:PEP-CTERM sorting domain-containing protein [Desulfobacterales bacterium]
MKRTLLILLVVGLLPLKALANPINTVSTSVVGNNIFDMNGMEVTVTLSDGTVETDTWYNNSAGGTGWSISYGGTNTSTMALDWSLTTNDTTTINNITIDAYANERVFFDKVWRYAPGDTSEGTFGSESGLWGPTLLYGLDTSGTVLADSVFLPTGEQYDEADSYAYYWAFSQALTLNAYPSTSPQPSPDEQDLFEVLYIDFVQNNLQEVIGTGLNGTFQFAVDTDLVAGTEIPEPSTMILFGIGLLGLGAVGRRKV